MNRVGIRWCSRALPICAFVVVVPLQASAEGGRAAGQTPTSERSAKPPPGSNEARAHDVEHQALDALVANRTGEAADLFGKAWTIFKQPDFICNRGGLLLMIGRYREAAESLETCRVASPESNGAVNDVVKRKLKQARAEVGTITVTTNVPGAEILVDNKVVGTAPLDSPLFVDPVNHIVEARAKGYASDAKLVPSSKGSWHEIGLTLEPPMKPGLVMHEPVPLPEGPLKATDPARQTALTYAASPSPSSVGSALQTSSGAPRSEPPNMGPVFFGIGVAALGATLGVGSLVAASGNREHAAQLELAIAERDKVHLCTELEADPRCGTVDSERFNAALFTAFGAGSLVLSAGGVAFAVYEIVRGSPAPQSRTPRVSISASPNGGAAFLIGRF